jgi:RNA polymerase-binding transcription factor DksA
MNTLPKIKTADMRQYQRDYRAARTARGECIYCGKPLPSARRALRRVACTPCTRAQS